MFVIRLYTMANFFTVPKIVPMIFLGDFGGNFLRMLIWSLRGGCLGKVKELNNLEVITCEVVEYVVDYGM